MPGSSSKAPAWVPFLLVVLACAAYVPSLGHRFVSFDDPEFVSENPWVSGGLTPQGLLWALTHTHHGHWQPLTLASHMFDAQVFGLRPAGHHFVNLLLHAVNALLLFGLLRRLTGSFWRSAWVAAAFAAHPLQVESVAWVSQRKTLLSALFGLLALQSYADYAREADGAPSGSREGGRHYRLAGFWLVLGLMAKPVLVVWPLLMLALDYWPLERRGPLRTLLTEKLPLMLPCLAFACITLAASSVSTLEALPLAPRLENAAVSCVFYVWKTLWPSDLAVFYPYPAREWLSRWWLPAAACLLAASAGFLAARKGRRFLASGWLWFLGSLVPTIGLVQAGGQAMADRYMYLPIVGLLVMIAWSFPAVEEPLAGRPLPARGALAVLCAGGAVAALAVAAGLQARHWYDSETLFRRASALSPANCVARNGLALALLERGALQDGELELQRAGLSCRDADTAVNLGFALALQGRMDEARAQLKEALARDPGIAARRLNARLLLEVLGGNGKSAGPGTDRTPR